MREIRSKAFLAAAALTWALSAEADDADVTDLRRQLEQLKQQSEAQARLIERLESRLQELELDRQRGRGVTQAQAPAQSAPSEPSASQPTASPAPAAHES